MNCREAEQSIFADRDGALDQTRRAALASHLETCAACRRIKSDLDGVVAAWRDTESNVRVPDPAFEWRRLARAISAKPERARVAWTRWIAIPVTVAAAAAVALYVAPGSNPPAAATRPTPMVARTETALPGPQTSTVVYVDDNSGWTFVWAPDATPNGHQI